LGRSRKKARSGSRMSGFRIYNSDTQRNRTLVSAKRGVRKLGIGVLRSETCTWGKDWDKGDRRLPRWNFYVRGP